MAVISPDTFDPLSRYVAVRLQQGVPIVDADENEREDIRRFEIQAFLKWFVGNGIPEGVPNAFQVDPPLLPAPDFIVRAGISGLPDALQNVGRCLVEGQDVIITADLTFVSQPLHAAQAGSAALAAAWGVPVIAPLTAPLATGVATVYLDTWARLITTAEDPGLVHPGLGTESCVRLRREFVVRVRDGAAAPAPADADFIPGHFYYALATLTRRVGDPNVAATDVADRRERRLLVPPASLVTDVLGLDPFAYRRGVGVPPVSLREAINALLRGDLPSSPEAPIAPQPGSDNDVGKGTFFDGVGGLVTFWSSNRVGATHQVFSSRLDTANLAGGFSAAQQATAGGVHLLPHAALLGTGEVLVVYQTGNVNEDIHMKRAPLATLNLAAPEIPIATTAGVRERNPFAVTAGSQVVIFWHSAATNQWQFNRYDVPTATFPGAPAALSATATTQRDLHATRDLTGSVWAAFRTTGSDIIAMEVPPAGAPINETLPVLSSGNPDQLPFVMVDAANNVWVFWSTAANGVWYQRFIRSTSTWEAAATNVPGTTAGPSNQAPAAVIDAEGAVWLFWQSNRGGNMDIWFMRRNPSTLVWGDPRQVTGSPDPDSSPFALTGSPGTLWLFWGRRVGLNDELFFRRVVTSV
jgi:hypothetical protein